MKVTTLPRACAGLAIGVVVIANGVTPAGATRTNPASDSRQVGVVLTWNRAMIDALEQAHTPPPDASRVSAIVQTSVFDAVNGVTGTFRPYRVRTTAPRHASAPAAAIGAAYRALSALFPAQVSSFDTVRAATTGRLRHPGSDRVESGLAWGSSVADEILAWRATDGFSAVLAPYVATPAPGRWQPTAPAFGPPAFRQFATMTPWSIQSATAFRPPAPPALTSARYAADYAETKSVGSLTSSTRSAFETQTAQVWASDAAPVIWNRVADSLLESRADRGLSLTAAARLLALTNIAMADAVISIWNSKNYFDTWRPITAIHAGDTDPNPLTAGDASWQPLLVTPSYQEYPAGHPAVSQAAAAVLAAQFGDRTAFETSSAALPGVVRAHRSFSSAVAQVVDARVFGGIHFRFAGDAAVAVGKAVAAQVLRTQMPRSRHHGSPCQDRTGTSAVALGLPVA